MKKILLCGLLCCAPIAVLAGCGGGGGGGNSGPRPTATPIGTNTVTIQLRDDLGGIVDGIVTLGSQRLATTSGEVTFTRVATGSVSLTVEVNGVTTTRTITVVTGTSTVPVTINASVTPTATSTVIPTPPF